VSKALDIRLQDFFEDEKTSMLEDDPLISQIYQLTTKQREALLAFLNTLH